MKHDTEGKQKFKRFVRRLRSILVDLPVATETVAVGILERLWNTTTRDAQAGDIGRLDDEMIADAVGWHGAPEKLIEILVECRWIERCSKHRLVIHDWPDHAPDFLRGNLKRHGKEFAIASCHSTLPKQPTMQPAIATSIPNLTEPNRTEPNETEPNRTEQAASAACAEPPQAACSALSEWVFPVTGKGSPTWALSELKLAEYLEAYPTIDLERELRNARQWLRDNPERRKTARGMLAFLTRWFNKAADSTSPARAMSSDPRGTAGVVQRFIANERSKSDESIHRIGGG